MSDLAPWPDAQVIRRSALSLLDEAKKSGPFFPEVIDSVSNRLVSDGWRWPVLVTASGEILSGAEEVVAAAELVANGSDEFLQIPLRVAINWTAAHVKAYAREMRRGDPPASWRDMMGFDDEWFMTEKTLLSLRWTSDNGKTRTEVDPGS